MNFNKQAEDLLMSEFIKQRQTEQITQQQEFLMSQFTQLNHNKTPSPKQQQNFQPFSQSNDFDQTNDFDESAISNDTPRLLQNDQKKPPKSVQRNENVKEILDIIAVQESTLNEKIIDTVKEVTQENTNTILNEFKELQKQMEMIQLDKNSIKPIVQKEVYDDKQLKSMLTSIQQELGVLKKDVSNNKYDEKKLMELLRLNSPKTEQKQYRQQEVLPQKEPEKSFKEIEETSSLKSIFIDQKENNLKQNQDELNKQQEISRNKSTDSQVQKQYKLKQQVQKQASNVNHRQEKPKEARKIPKNKDDNIKVRQSTQQVDRVSKNLQRSSSTIKDENKVKKQKRLEERETLIINDLQESRTHHKKFRDVGIQQYKEEVSSYSTQLPTQYTQKQQNYSFNQQTSFKSQSPPKQQKEQPKKVIQEVQVQEQQQPIQEPQKPLAVSSYKPYQQKQPSINDPSQNTSLGEIYPKYDAKTAQKYEKDGHGIGAWENSAYSNWNLSSLYKSEFSDISEGEMRQNFAHVQNFPYK